MSHELRTPLNSLLILAGELADNHEGNLTETQVQYASVIHSSGTDLLRLLNDILDLAKVESGTVTLEISELPLAELQRRPRARLPPRRRPEGPRLLGRARARRSRRAIATDPRAPAPGAEEPALQRVQVHRARRGAACASALARERLEPGERDARARRRGRRVQRHRHRHRHHGRAAGSACSRPSRRPTARRPASTAAPGSGLSISRELVRLLGGEIALSSTPGEGSTFTVYLPSTAHRRATRRAAPHRLRARGPRSAANGHSAGAAVAVADVRPRSHAEPDPASDGRRPDGQEGAGRRRRHPQRLRAHLAARALRGSRSSRRRAGRRASTSSRRRRTSTSCSMDIMMPIMDGYATMRAMRKLTPTDDLPIIAVTASVEAGERQRCIDAGATAYVTKPVDTAEPAARPRRMAPVGLPLESRPPWPADAGGRPDRGAGGVADAAGHRPGGRRQRGQAPRGPRDARAVGPRRGRGRLGTRRPATPCRRRASR